VGWRLDLPRVYRDLDAVVLCSLNEGTPVSLIEALTAARPVAATRVGGVGDLLGWEGSGPAPGRAEEAPRGLLVPPKDSPALAEALRKIQGEPQAAAERARAGRAYAEERFGVERLVADLSVLYREG
ncbi:MAG: glycosyltransferase, partial [Nitrospinota bacterium]